MHHVLFCLGIYVIGLFLIETVTQVTGKRKSLEDNDEMPEEAYVLAEVLWPLVAALIPPSFCILGVGLAFYYSFKGINKAYKSYIIAPLRRKYSDHLYYKQNSSQKKKGA